MGLRVVLFLYIVIVVASRFANMGGLTKPVNVQPGTSKCTPTFSFPFKSQLRCSASDLTAALLALYAGLP